MFYGSKIHLEFATQKYLRTSKMLAILSFFSSHADLPLCQSRAACHAIAPASFSHKPTLLGSHNILGSHKIFGSHNILGSSILTGLQGPRLPPRPSCQLFYRRPLNREDDWEVGGGSYTSVQAASLLPLLLHAATFLHKSKFNIFPSFLQGRPLLGPPSWD